MTIFPPNTRIRQTCPKCEVPNALVVETEVNEAETRLQQTAYCENCGFTDQRVWTRTPLERSGG